MNAAIPNLDKRFARLRPLIEAPPPPKGWLRAVRNALGMTTMQFARRLGVSQPRIVELEQSEANGTVTLNTLQRAAEALGCRLVYVIVPERPLAQTVRERAERVANRQLADVEHTMRLEAQSVTDKRVSRQLRRQRIEELLRRPAALWRDE